MLTREDVFNIILDEKIKVENYILKNDLTQWFWKVGFRNISVNEETKHIVCEVSRPNQFISKFKKPIINFLIHLSEHVFPKQGYTFELKKYVGDEYFDMLTLYNNTNRGNLKWL